MPYFAVRLIHAEGWDDSRPIREQAGWDEHASFMDALVDEGVVIVGGPVGDGGQTLHLIQARDDEEVRTRLARDPWFRSKLLHVGSIEPWALWLDGRVTARG